MHAIHRWVSALSSALLLTSAAGAAEATLRVDPSSAWPFPAEVLGQFLEVPNWGEENGADAAWDPAAGALRADVLAKLRQMRLSFVRFPGGTGIDHHDWTRFIDRAPGRPAGEPRPVYNAGEPGELRHHFGYDEYLNLAEKEGWQSLLPVNFLDGLLRRKPLEEAAAHAAALVAYVNAPVGADLPADLAPWARLREANGRRPPWKVGLWQLGNEWFVPGYGEEVRKVLGSAVPEEIAAWYRTCILAYARAMRRVDPSIRLVVDGEIHDGVEPLVLGDPQVRQVVSLATFHRYAPWAVLSFRGTLGQRAAAPHPPTELWRCLVSMPGDFRADGQSTWGGGRAADLAAELGYALACTEWNWNGWQAAEGARDFEGVDALAAAGIGAGGFLNGLLRDRRVVCATQSMAVGRRWNIAAIRLDEGRPPRHLPQAAAPRLYARHHGSRILASQMEDSPRWVPTLAPNERPFPEHSVSALDVLVSATEETLFLHVVNRDPEAAIRLRVAGIAWGAGEGRRHGWQAPPLGERVEGDLVFAEEQVAADWCMEGLAVPPRSISVYELPRAPSR